MINEFIEQRSQYLNWVHGFFRSDWSTISLMLPLYPCFESPVGKQNRLFANGAVAQ